MWIVSDDAQRNGSDKTPWSVRQHDDCSLAATSGPNCLTLTSIQTTVVFKSAKNTQKSCLEKLSTQSDLWLKFCYITATESICLLQPQSKNTDSTTSDFLHCISSMTMQDLPSAYIMIIYTCTCNTYANRRPCLKMDDMLLLGDCHKLLTGTRWVDYLHLLCRW